jgi:Xaa-Pro dipeptidase
MSAPQSSAGRFAWTADESRRAFLRDACAVPLIAATMARRAAAGEATAQAPAAAAPPISAAAPPISAAERRERIAKVQRLMSERGIGALLVESGASLEYFTGIRWRLSERTTAAVIPARGEILIVTPAFEEPSVRETLEVDGDVRPWNEADNPFVRIAQGLKDLGVRSGTLAIEPTVRFFIIDGVRRASKGYAIVSGDPLIRACRMIKSPAELALMQAANNVTIEALRRVHARTERGVSASDLGELMNGATIALGGSPEFALILLNEASAFPHGSSKPQTVREGSIILMDCGCSVHGYQSDISRTWVYGEPNARQHKIWNTVKRGQEIALATAELGLPAGRIDDAVRSYYESEGWGPGYKLPGLSHRTGHGIGLDGHEAPYLVHGDATSLDAGMCFSDEPGIYIPGEFGVRLEDCWHMTATGPALFTPLAKSIEEPI